LLRSSRSLYRFRGYAVDQDFPALHRIEAEQEVADRRFPLPVCPTRATVWPGKAVKEMFFSTSVLPS